MPELPEVETAVRGLREPLVGRTISGAIFPQDPGRMVNIDPALIAQRIAGQMRQQLEEEKSRLVRELRGEVAGLSILAAEKLVRHSMNQKVQDELLGDFFQELDKQKPN